jgi:hypothetical protein
MAHYLGDTIAREFLAQQVDDSSGGFRGTLEAIAPIPKKNFRFSAAEKV